MKPEADEDQDALPVVRAADLDDGDTRPRWLIDTLWARAAVGVLGGAPKCRLSRARDKRHTFASHLAMRGVPLKVIQELLGHSSIATTMIYAHLAPHVARDAVRVLDRARTPVGTPNAAPAPAPSHAPKRAPKRARNSAPQLSSAPPIPAPLAKDRRNPAEPPVTN